MLPTAITLRNFRSFGGTDPVKLELRPITLLFGRNGGGKSSLIRSLPLLADSIGYGRLDALNLEDRLALFDLDFDSLRWKGRTPTDDHTIGLGLQWDGDPDIQEVVWAIHEQDEWHRLVVKRFSVTAADRSNSLAADWWMTRGEEKDLGLTYDVRCGNEATKRERLSFLGLLPRSELADSYRDVLREVESRLAILARSVVWLHSLRPAPKRYTRWSGAIRWELKPDGSDAPIVLAGEEVLRKDVSEWYERHVGFQLVLEESTRKREVRTMLRNRNRSSYDIDLIDTGEGLSECLPVLTALAMARQSHERGGPSIVAIEEPGSHLHPDLQKALIERVCAVAVAANARIVLETHSEIALLALQHAVIKGPLKPEDVVIYWVDQNPMDGRSFLDKVELDRVGRFHGNWPPDAFQQDIQLAADVQDARDEREGRQ